MLELIELAFSDAIQIRRRAVSAKRRR
jgi:hypothetical protein